jgi:glycosyltransferase involved in cell wall biosynthesis
MKDLIIGCFTGHDWSSVQYWANSIDLCGFAGDRAVMVYDTDSATIDRLNTLGFAVHSFDPKEISTGFAYDFEWEHNYAPRFQIYYEYLSNLRNIDDYRYVVATDVRDVVFQTDPSAWLAEHLSDKKICASRESLGYQNEPWDDESMRNAYPRLYYRMAPRPIWNCGVQAGEIRLMRDFWLQLSMACAAGLEAADRAAYNILLSLLPWSEITLFAVSEAGWACQAGTRARPARIERFRPHLLEAEPLWDGTFACTSAGRPHVILHQYNRVPEWCTSVHRRYGSPDSPARGPGTAAPETADEEHDRESQTPAAAAAPHDGPVSKLVYNMAITRQNSAIASALASIDAEIAGLANDHLDDLAARLPQSRVSKTSARIAAYLGVKDEAELVEATIAHLRTIGVDHIVACDMGSTDGTWELLERYRSNDDFWLLQLDDHEPGYFEKWDQTVAAQVKHTGADWAIFLDADEYWIPASGSLRECAGLATADILSVPRFNVPLGAAGPAMPDRLVPGRYDELLLLVKPIPDFHAYLKENPESPWIEGVPDQKPMARPQRIAGFTIWGAHDIVVAGENPVRRANPTDLVIAHLPFSTRSRFARKVDNIRRIFAVHDRHFGQDVAWHWRRWLALADQGRLDDEFDRTVFDAHTIEDLRRRGVIKSALEFFADAAGSVMAPAADKNQRQAMP